MTASIEALKEKARRHEQDEEWRKALDLYLRAIRRLEEEDRPDIGLHNRVGDLFTRVGEPEEAVEHYETAVDLYEEADLPNNAIAVCKKIIRNVPERHRVFLRMGLIRARQGFVVDARDHFLTYAQRMQAAGDVDEALRALVEFADLVPDDAEVRLALAAQYEAHGHPDEAVEQVGLAYATFVAAGDTERADQAAAKLGELAPEVDPSSFVGRSPARPGVRMAEEPDARDDVDLLEGPDMVDELEGLDGFEIAVASDEVDREPDREPVAEPETPDDGMEADEAALTLDEPLPYMSFDDEEHEGEPDAETDDDVGEPLPFLEGTADLAPPVEPAAPVPTEAELDAASDWTDPQPAEEEHADPAHADVDAFESVGDDGVDVPEAPPTAEPWEDDLVPAEPVAGSPESAVAQRQRDVEAAFRSGDENALAEAYLGLASALEAEGDGDRARSVFQQVLAIDPGHSEAQAGLRRLGADEAPVAEVASSEDYVDLGALILGDDAEKTTRFVVAYEEPSGDEDADFRRMLTQFKAKVAQNVDASDVRAHHDLGMAYREMGLLDEAIEQFQKALRASADHLATYEALGQAFLEKQAPAAAARVLTRALDAPWEVEDELLGIYYYLGRAYEAQGDARQAVDFYDRVFALDINFADVTERLRVLR